ncbi:GCN5-related N-acetyltransferase [Catenulispora acidiphila DSM 44928]|uniref:GCN5-related N-acetyltransferase n=1 Tax=Catenulispora acidiphila (strain DSM 44928 / JCM 14897 / NBRC 102108 / NRRL B-24433 / ID139908) TaxID=479433 RepID=C7Q9P3_CATAD|nr:GNAT family N-acetyltransferase [Catenulispora acidiphila]ACU76212.1 GCN5-related N-acetyltransferase [Catenulispora acidiphila DSM 44928]
MTMQIRPATDEDWPHIWPFFRSICAEGETYVYPYEPTEAEGCSMWMEQPPGLTVVAVDAAGTVLGSAKMGPNRPGPGAHVSTASYMVDPAAAGRGVGRALGEYTLAWAREQGYRAMQFNAVVESNARAVHLWRSIGFEIIGTVPEAFLSRAHGYVGIHVMHQKLD